MTESRDRRAVLLAIAYGRDPEVRPSDRLRALELLRDLPERELDTESLYRRDLAAMPEGELIGFLDSLLAAEVGTSGFRSERFPETGAVLAAEVERRVRELGDATRIEQEIERRAEKRARELYATRSFTVIERDREDLPPGGEHEPDEQPVTEDLQFEAFKRLTADD